MAGSGLKEVFSQVYTEGNVDHMLSGKAVPVLSMTRPLVVVGDDTDLLVLLQHHFYPEHNAVQTSNTLIDIGVLRENLDPD